MKIPLLIILSCLLTSNVLVFGVVKGIANTLAVVSVLAAMWLAAVLLA